MISNNLQMKTKESTTRDFSLMASINGKDDEYDEVQYESLHDDHEELLTHSHALLAKYKLLKKKFLKLEKELSSYKIENLSLV